MFAERMNRIGMLALAGTAAVPVLLASWCARNGWYTPQHASLAQPEVSTPTDVTE